MADAKQGKTPDDFYNGSSQSRIILAKPRLGGFGSSNFPSTSSKNFNPFGSVLRPSQLKPGSNPFLKVDPQDTSAEDEKDKEKEKEKLTEENVEERLKENKEDTEVPKFVPLGSTNAAPRNSSSIPATVQPTTSSPATGFVFGQNLSDRVVIQENIKNGEASEDHGSMNGSSELLFTNAAASVRDGGQEEAGSSESGSADGLAAAAAEYERSHARPPLPAASCTVTGEEDETNVIQISCRLFAWEAGQWRERGRGVLRLNDSACGARLVARSAGALRVVLNTKLWPDMVAERAGAKSLRLTAADAEQRVKLFLVMGAPGDIAQLHRALLTRIAVSKTQRSTEKLDSSAIKDYNQEGDAEIEEKHNEDLSDTPDENDMSEERFEDTTKKTDDESQTNDITEETKAIKRKEPIEDETLPKRQCPDTN